MTEREGALKSIREGLLATAPGLKEVFDSYQAHEIAVSLLGGGFINRTAVYEAFRFDETLKTNVQRWFYRYLISASPSTIRHLLYVTLSRTRLDAGSTPVQVISSNQPKTKKGGVPEKKLPRVELFPEVSALYILDPCPSYESFCDRMGFLLDPANHPEVEEAGRPSIMPDAAMPKTKKDEPKKKDSTKMSRKSVKGPSAQPAGGDDSDVSESEPSEEEDNGSGDMGDARSPSGRNASILPKASAASPKAAAVASPVAAPAKPSPASPAPAPMAAAPAP